MVVVVVVCYRADAMMCRAWTRLLHQCDAEMTARMQRKNLQVPPRRGAGGGQDGRYEAEANGMALRHVTRQVMDRLTKTLQFQRRMLQVRKR